MGEETGKMISSEWRLFNRNIDSFFSNQRYLVGENKSNIFISTTFHKAEGSNIETDFDLQMRFDLPRTTKKLKVVVEREQNEIKKALTDENVTRSKRRTKITSRYSSVGENKYTAGVDYLIPKLKYFRSLIKVGFRIDMPINPFLKLNMQKEFKTEYVDIDLMQTFLLYRQAGFQEISQVAFNRKINETFNLEQLNSLVWTDEKDIFELRHSLTLYHHLSEEKGFSYAIGANARFTPSYHYDNYDASAGYRQMLFGKWLFGTFTVGADFAKSNRWDDQKFVQLRFEAFFK